MRKKLLSQNRVIHLNLIGRWFDMIESGIKKEEYRELSDYWNKIFTNYMASMCSFRNGKLDEMSIIFSNGYSKSCRQMEVRLLGIDVSIGKVEWGAELGKYYNVLRLGEVLKKNY